ncbi:MAG: cytochrome b/b6 domain-containing protein [Acidimicrobiia bacterium]|nr:cytochrome b/b6 domain-containing protein [Acidimicrobiia bacterium]
MGPVQDFIADYPGTTTTPPPPYSGFPGWLRWQHFFNLFFMMFIIRAGIQILADHPRLYWNRHSTPGTEWFRFNKPVPTDRVWTAKDDSVRLPGWLGIPGIRHSIGLARWWHFGFDTLWIRNGVLFYVLLFTTSQWGRIVPTSWDVIPNAISTAIQYLSLDFPTNEGWIAYNGLQLLAYFLTVFIAAPLALVTGLMQAPLVREPVQARGPGREPPGGTLHPLVRADLDGWLHRDPHAHDLDHGPARQRQPHHDRRGQHLVAGLAPLRPVDGGHHGRLGRGHPVDAPPSTSRAAGRPRADRSAEGGHGAPGPEARRVHGEGHLPAPVAQREDARLRGVLLARGQRLPRLPAADRRPRREAHRSSLSTSCGR